MQKIFEARSRNIYIKKNFPNIFQDTKCVIPECDREDSQYDLFYCEFLSPRNQMMINPVQYRDIFSNCVEKQLLVTQILNQKYESRMKFMASLVDSGASEDQGGSASGSRV